MYNPDMPTRAELPSSRQLLKSTIIAVIVAKLLLITVVLPSEYAVDPTGIGRKLGLTQMGEIKMQLANEAASDRLKDEELKRQQQPQPEKKSGLGATIAGWFIGSARADEARYVAQAARQDEIRITLKPTEGVEYKLTMKKGAKASYSWKVEGGVVNFDLHGTPGKGKEQSYKKGRGVAGEEGVLEAAFEGSHGWFWRNRGSAPVTIILKTNGDYSELKRMV
jgi:hypothetical protein